MSWDSGFSTLCSEETGTERRINPTARALLELRSCGVESTSGGGGGTTSVSQTGGTESRSTGLAPRVTGGFGVGGMVVGFVGVAVGAM